LCCREFRWELQPLAEFMHMEDVARHVMALRQYISYVKFHDNNA